MTCTSPNWNNQLYVCVGWDGSPVTLPTVVLDKSPTMGDTHSLDLSSLESYTTGWDGVTILDSYYVTT